MEHGRNNPHSNAIHKLFILAVVFIAHVAILYVAWESYRSDHLDPASSVSVQ